MTIQTINNYSTTLAADLAAAATSCTVAAGDGAPLAGASAANPYHLTLASGGKLEVVAVTAVAGDVLTIVRAQEGSSDQQWLTGMPLEARVTSAILDQGGGGQAGPPAILDHGNISLTTAINASASSVHKLFVSASTSIALESGLDPTKFWQMELSISGSQGLTLSTGINWVLDEAGGQHIPIFEPGGYSAGFPYSGGFFVTVWTYDGGTSWNGKFKQV